MTPLEEACAISLKRWVDSLPDEFEQYEFSKKHNRRMKVLFGKMRGGKYHHLTKRSTIVLVAAILLLTMTITALAIPASREFIIEHFLDHSTYSVVGGEYSEIGNIEIGYIPYGFKKTYEMIGKSEYILSYTSLNEEKWFDIRVIQNKDDVLFDTEKNREQIVYGKTTKYIVYYDNSLNHRGILWNYNSFSYSIVGSITTEEQIKIADSIKGS